MKNFTLFAMIGLFAIDARAAGILADDLMTDGFEPPGACVNPPGLTRVTTSSISYGVYPTPVRPNVDVREWDNIWGHFGATDPVQPWPGFNGSGPTLRNFARTHFLAAHFRTGATTTPFGFFTRPFEGALAMDMTIATTCGRFTAPPGCVATNIGLPGNTLVSWTFATGNPLKCILRPNTDYWVNIKYHDPDSTLGCAAGSPVCPLPTLVQSAR